MLFFFFFSNCFCFDVKVEIDLNSNGHCFWSSKRDHTNFVFVCTSLFFLERSKCPLIVNPRMANGKANELNTKIKV